jgi:hypothetical protein
VSSTNALLMIISDVVISVPILFLVPRSRQSQAFDRLLWSATFILGCVGAWLALEWAGIDIAGRSAAGLVPIILGTLGGALGLNLLLWAMDRIAPPEIEVVQDDEAEHEDTDRRV